MATLLKHLKGGLVQQILNLFYGAISGHWRSSAGWAGPMSLELGLYTLKGHYQLTVKCTPCHCLLITCYGHFQIIFIWRYMCKFKVYPI